MTAAKKLNLISVEDYLAGELKSPIKHEYVGGVVYAMAGARNVHNDIAMNSAGALYARLRGKKCRAFNSDTKIRVQLPRQVRFYYPDAGVVCHPNPREDTYHDEPVVIVEVLSLSTRRIDEGEKKEAYLTIPSLGAYLLVERDEPKVVVYQREADDFVAKVYEGLDAAIPLPDIEIELPLAEIYERVEFEPEADETE
jgi:Uma2 family endonuclease